MSHVGRYEEIDKDALYHALLAERRCPHCRRPLLPVAGLGGDVWGCRGGRTPGHPDVTQDHATETWYLPASERA